MGESIVVTGAGGNVGGHVVRSLRQRGAQTIAAVFRPQACVGRFDAAVECRKLDFFDRETWADAVHSATAMFLVRPPAISEVETTLNPFVDAARAAGVRDVVFLSVAGAGENHFVPHRKVEDHLKSVDMDFVNLRPGFFAQNLETEYRRDIVEDDRLYVPAGDKPVNWIDVRDIAEVAATILVQPEEHRRSDLTLTGPGPESWDEVAHTLTDVCGRKISYEPASIPGYGLHLKTRGKPLGAIAVQTILHTLLRYGQGDIYDPALENILGRKATSIHTYIRDNASIWSPTTSKSREADNLERSKR